MGVQMKSLGFVIAVIVVKNIVCGRLKPHGHHFDHPLYDDCGPRLPIRGKNGTTRFKDCGTVDSSACRLEIWCEDQEEDRYNPKRRYEGKTIYCKRYQKCRTPRWPYDCQEFNLWTFKGELKPAKIDRKLRKPCKALWRRV